MRKRWPIIGAAALIVAAVAWYVASPWYTLHQMRSAVQANDADAMSAYIDYPALREDMKAEIMAQVTAEARKDRSGYGMFGTALASAMVGPMVDSLVTPAGMRAAFAVNRNRPRGAPEPKQPGASAFDVSEEVKIDRRGVSEFTVSNPQRNNGIMIFRRHGLGWKLSGVDLPPAQVPQT